MVLIEFLVDQTLKLGFFLSLGNNFLCENIKQIVKIAILLDVPNKSLSSLMAFISESSIKRYSNLILILVLDVEIYGDAYVFMLFHISFERILSFP